MPNLTQLREQGRALIAKQHALVNDSRPWSAEKKQTFDQIDADIKAVAEQVERAERANAPFPGLFDAASTTPPVGVMSSALQKAYGPPVPSPRFSIAPDQAEELRDAALSNKSLRIDLSSITNATDSTSITPAGIPDYRLPPYTMLREPNRVLDLLPKAATSSPVVTYYTTTGTTAAAAVAEGGAKPLSTLSYTPVNATLTKLAHYVEVTDETLQDFPAFMTVLQSDMTAGLIKAENAELLTSTVTGAHKFAGLIPAAGITRARVTEIQLDTIALAFDDLRNGTSFAEPDGIIMHPTDWGTVRRLKDGQSRYYLDADPSKAVDLTLWGKPVTLTTQMTQGTALVGAFNEAAVVFIRDGIRVEVANQGQTQFTSNTTLVRAEERLTLGVVRPSAIVKVTGL